MGRCVFGEIELLGAVLFVVVVYVHVHVVLSLRYNRYHNKLYVRCDANCQRY